MPTRLRHRHRVGHGPCSTRLLTLGPPLIAALPLGACGPAHKGQLTVEPTGASPKTTPSGSPAPSATPSATAWTAPNITISNDKTGTWQQQDDILKQPVATSTGISQAYNFDTGGCPAVIFYNADRSIYSERKRGGDNTTSSVKVQQTMSNHTSFVVTSGTTPVEAIPDNNGTLPGYEIECEPDKLASTDTWHQFLSSTRVAGLDAGAMG